MAACHVLPYSPPPALARTLTLTLTLTQSQVAGGNRNAGKASEMLFDCSESYWPDASADEYLVYTWSLDEVGTAAKSTNPSPNPSSGPESDP